MAATARPLLPFDVWPPGITQAATPANDNALRAEVIAAGVLSIANTEPGSPDDRDLYIIGDEWAAYPDEVVGTLAHYVTDTWSFWQPYEGAIKNVAGTLYEFTGGAWAEISVAGAVDWGGIGGTLADQTDLADALADVEIVTEASAFTVVPATHKGRNRLILAGDDITFDSAEALASGQVYSIRATSALELIEDGVTLTPPAGGTLELDAGMSVAVYMTGSTTGVVIGQTVAA